MILFLDEGQFAQMADGTQRMAARRVGLGSFAYAVETFQMIRLPYDLPSTLFRVPMNTAVRPRMSDSNFDSNAGERARILAVRSEQQERRDP